MKNLNGIEKFRILFAKLFELTDNMHIWRKEIGHADILRKNITHF